MGMFDTIYAELDCPFCGKQFRYAPMTWDDAKKEVVSEKRWKLEQREKRTIGGEARFQNS